MLALTCFTRATDAAGDERSSDITMFDTFTHRGQLWRIYRAFNGVWTGSHGLLLPYRLGKHDHHTGTDALKHAQQFMTVAYREYTSIILSHTKPHRTTPGCWTTMLNLAACSCTVQWLNWLLLSQKQVTKTQNVLIYIMAWGCGVCLVLAALACGAFRISTNSASRNSQNRSSVTVDYAKRRQ